MGSCNSSEGGGPKVSSAIAYNACGTPLSSEVGTKRSDGAAENPAVHEGAILGIASAGIDKFLTCGEDKTLRLHDLVDKESGNFRTRLTFSGHTKTVSRATHGMTTGLIYSCSRDTTIRQWNGRDTSATRVFEGHDLACTDLALSPDERTLCSGSRDTSVRTWDVQTGRCTASAKVPRNLVTCLKFLTPSTSPSSSSSSSKSESSQSTPSSVVVQGGEDLRLRVWDLREDGLRPSLTVEGYTFFPICLDVSADHHEVLTSCKGFNGSGCETKLWDIRNTASALRKYTGHTQDTTACVFLDPKEEGGVIGGRGGGGRGGGTKAEQGAENVDGALCDPSSPFSCASRRMIATASKDGSVKIYDLENGSLIVNHVEPECGGYTGLAIQHDSSTGRPLLYASTITGGLYAFRLEGPAEGGPADDRWGGKLPSEGEEGRLRCVGFVRGSPIL